MPSKRVPLIPATLDVEAKLSPARKNPIDLGILLELYRPYLLAIARAEMDPMLSGKAGASDLVQEALVVAHREFGKFRGESEPTLRRWLRGILLNVILDWHRRFYGTDKRSAKRERSFDDLESRKLLLQLTARNQKSPGSEFDLKQMREALNAALARLSEVDRQIIEWRYFEGQSFAEIAVKLNRTQDAVRMLANRAVRRLAREMGIGDDAA